MGIISSMTGAGFWSPSARGTCYGLWVILPHHKRNYCDTPLDDSWIFQVDANDFSTGTWTLQTHGEADAPTARTSHAMAPLAEGKVLLYGGLGYIETEEPLDDVWIFEDDSWSQVNSSLHNSPGPRFGHSLTPLAKGSGQVIMFGGVFQGDNSSTTMQDTWVFDFGTRNWEEKKSSMLPPPRQGHATAYTKVFDVNAVLMFGGYSGTGRFSQVTRHKAKGFLDVLC